MRENNTKGTEILIGIKGTEILIGIKGTEILIAIKGTEILIGIKGTEILIAIKISVPVVLFSRDQRYLHREAVEQPCAASRNQIRLPAATRRMG